MQVGPDPQWAVFQPPGPKAFGGDTPAERAANRKWYLAQCRCAYCGESVTAGQQFALLLGQQQERNIARAHMVHRTCWESDDGPVRVGP